jgi:ATP-binding cassette subfamily B multidrug efflux pump
MTSLIRWQNHSYVLKQSLNFFQNDFAGRIAQRIMQTGNSLRDSPCRRWMRCGTC